MNFPLVLLFIATTRAYITKEDPFWPSSTTWMDDLEAQLSDNASLTLVENSSSYIEQCEALGDNAYDLANNGFCMQAHLCARKFCKSDLFGFDLPAAVLDVRTPDDIKTGL